MEDIIVLRVGEEWFWFLVKDVWNGDVVVFVNVVMEMNKMCI